MVVGSHALVTLVGVFSGRTAVRACSMPRSYRRMLMFTVTTVTSRCSTPLDPGFTIAKADIFLAEDRLIVFHDRDEWPPSGRLRFTCRTMAA